MEVDKSIEDYLVDWAKRKYAGRVISQVNTEFEAQFVELGKNPDFREYEWMVKRLLEVHNQMNVSPDEGKKDEKEIKN